MQKQVTKEATIIYVGIDVHLKSWKVTLASRHSELKNFSQEPSPETLANYLKKNYPGATYKAVYEAGVFGFNSCRRLREMGVHCEMVHPMDVPTTNKEKQQKTDKIDSRKLARLLRNHEFEFIYIPPVKLEADRTILRQRFAIVADLSRTKNRIKSLLMQFSIEIPDAFKGGPSRHWSKNYIEWLKQISLQQLAIRHVLDQYIAIGQSMRENLLVINRRIKQLSLENDYQLNYNWLISIPGIGMITAMSLILELGDINRFKTLDKLCNFIGLVPSMHGSGDKMRTGKIVRRGRRSIKVMLIEASWQLVRHDPAMTFKFEQLCLTMPKNKAIIRIARKLVARIRYVLKNQKAYQLGLVK